MSGKRYTGRAPARIKPLVALLRRRGKFLVGEPFFLRSGPLTVQAAGKAKPGELVLLGPSGARRGGQTRVMKRIGSPDVARNVIEALMLDRGLRRSFPDGLRPPAMAQLNDKHPRTDLTALPTLTIDPDSAKDFDDAISAERLASGNTRVYVHIADVSAYVVQGSDIDRVAYRRATSVYVPGAVEPMLPEVLSNRACSLVPGEDRFAVTVEMEFDQANVVKVSFYRSVIRSDLRLTYGQVDGVFAGTERLPAPFGELIELTRATSRALADQHHSGGGLTVESSEPEFVFDAAGNVTAAEAVSQTESHRLIEQLMVVANEQVAKYLVQRNLPGLFRVHAQPDQTRIEWLAERLESLDVPTPALLEQMTAATAGSYMAQFSELINTEVIRRGHGREGLTTLMLRSLKQAEYLPENLGHSGLGLEHYCHFTSPIRRYPDLVCHRALLAGLGIGDDLPQRSKLGENAQWCSERERDAMAIERDGDKIAASFLLNQQLRAEGFDQVFEGEVIGMIEIGAFVRFGGVFEGMLPVRRMRGEWWELNIQETALVARGSGKALRIGDPVQVQVAKVETARGRIDLDLA